MWDCASGNNGGVPLGMLCSTKQTNSALDSAALHQTNDLITEARLFTKSAVLCAPFGC